MGPGDRTNTRCWYSFGQRVGIGPDVVEHHERARSGRCLRPIDGGDALHGRLNEQMRRNPFQTEGGGSSMDGFPAGCRLRWRAACVA